MINYLLDLRHFFHSFFFVVISQFLISIDSRAIILFPFLFFMIVFFSHFATYA